MDAFLGRIKKCNDLSIVKKKYVVYWMQASQRSECNHALEYSIEKANELHLPLVVVLVLIPEYPNAGNRHYAFMIRAIPELKRKIEERGASFILRTGNPVEEIVELASNAACLIIDRGYLRFQRKWRFDIAVRVKCSMIQIESDIVVPVETAMHKEAYNARSLRLRIQQVFRKFLCKPQEHECINKSGFKDWDSVDMTELTKLKSFLPSPEILNSEIVSFSGTEKAKERLENFISNKLDRYAIDRNDPLTGCVSGMSVYLHFGQISPVYIACEILKSGSPGINAYLEELVIRRELSINFVFYNPLYDRYECLPAWAVKSLQNHASDPREYQYDSESFESGKTHDPYWNAIQKRMVRDGTMHGYMRMYWGKKILEWSENPQSAFKTAIYLNDKYQMDGRDPNGYAGIAWCFGKHDRPWKTRQILGSIRSMTNDGLKRKFDLSAYIRSIE